jgi:hypothetical protein
MILTPSITIENVTVNEGAGNATAQVTLSGVKFSGHGN